MQEDALQLFELGNFDKAAAVCSNILSIDPKNAEVLNIYGLIEYSKGNLSKAEQLISKSIELDPLNLAPQCNYTCILEAQGKSSKAVQVAERIIVSKPDLPEAHYNLGISLQSLEKYDEAIDAYTKAIKFNPSYLQALNNLGVVYKDLGYYQQARETLEQALIIAPNYAELHYGLGTVHHLMNKQLLAVRHFQKAITLKPEYASAHCDLGATLIELKRFPEASEVLNQAKALNPKSAIVYYNLGNFFRLQNHLPEAITHYRKAVEIAPDYIKANWNLAFALLQAGQLQEGWELYPWRWENEGNPKPNLSKPEWDGKPLKNGTLLIHSEQGFGDNIQFIRYIKHAKTRARKLILAVEEPLQKLFQSMDEIDLVVTKSNIASIAEKYDAHIPLLSLPGIFNTTLESIPKEIPYLFANRELTDKYSDIFKEYSGVLKVGFVWHGNQENTVIVEDKSCRLDDFSCLFSTPNTIFFSLQKDTLVPDNIQKNNSVIDLSTHLKSFADTAALVEHLDLVISIDTAVAHLSGAMGKPTWTLLPFSADWRWLLNRNDSPYYPTMKLFRQKEWGQWDSVFHNLKTNLARITPQQNPEFYQKTLAEDDLTKENKTLNSKKDLADETLYLGLTKGENFGWGVCSKYLIKELSNIINIVNINEDKLFKSLKQINGKFLQAITGVDLYGLNDDIQATKNYGYTFFEDELTKLSIENAKKFECILAGSTWCKERLIEKGIQNCDTLLQGIDPEIFYPITHQKEDGYFVIFSGGKFELRKGQDVVLKAVKILQDIYPDIILLTNWYNIWPHTMQNMALSSNIKYQYQGNSWDEIMGNIYAINGLDSQRIKTLPLVPNEIQREIYAKTDIAVFPNRCEGGTNLVLMEYMACAKPVIASYCSGHTDIINKNNSLMLKEFQELQLVDNNQKLMARWSDPSVDELVAAIEFAYHNRDEMKRKGEKAGKDLKKFTWEKSAERVLELLY